VDRCRGSGTIGEAVLVLSFVVAFAVVACCLPTANQPDDPHLAALRNKLDAVRYLNEVRNGTVPLLQVQIVLPREKAPPVDLIELNVAKWRAEYLGRSGLISAYDREGRHPLYWYTRLDGGLYGVEEAIIWKEYSYTSPEELKRDYFRYGVDNAIHYYRGGAFLNPCYNYVAMESSYRYGGRGGIKYYVFWMVAKWIDWVSPPLYEGGRFTAEGYADPAMRPVALVVRYAPHAGNINYRVRYDLGGVYYCKYLDPPSSCKDALEPEGTFTVSRVLDNGRWYVKIDAYVQLNRTGLYTFELIAEDLRSQSRRCPLMHYTVEVTPRR